MSRAIIIDASVAAKWLLDDEVSFQADKIKEEFLNNSLTIQAPTVIYYEINNLLKSSAISQRISPSKAIKVFQGFLDLGFIIHASKELLTATLKKALELDISSYDASYIALAESLQIPLYTADEKLVKKAKSRLVKNLSDY